MFLPITKLDIYLFQYIKRIFQVSNAANLERKSWIKISIDGGRSCKEKILFNSCKLYQNWWNSSRNTTNDHDAKTDLLCSLNRQDSRFWRYYGNKAYCIITQAKFLMKTFSKDHNSSLKNTKSTEKSRGIINYSIGQQNYFYSRGKPSKVDLMKSFRVSSTNATKGQCPKFQSLAFFIFF